MKENLASIIEKLRSTPLPEKIGVAVSGGMDSMVLLSVLLKCGFSPIVLNVEHGIRGESSVRDTEFVKSYAKSHNLSIKTTSVDALAYAKENNVSVELAARTLRYEFFDKLLSEKEVDVIALAHHADDNAETILMRIFRGTGIKGLIGITDRSGYIRPLIKVSREEITAYAKANDIPYVEDETNLDSAYTRNFIRNELLPLIKDRYPDVINSFSRLADNAAEVDEYLTNNMVIPTETDDGSVLKNLFSQPVIIQKYSINAAMKELGAVKDVEKVHFDALLDLKNSQNNSSLDLPFGITAVKYNDDLILSVSDKKDFTPTPFDANKTYEYGNYVYRFVKGDRIISGATVDPKKVVGCVVRTRRDGDKFWRVNGKNKLLSDFLNEKKLTKRQKDNLLVLAKEDVVYAILGLETAEQAKADKDYLIIIKEKMTYDE